MGHWLRSLENRSLHYIGTKTFQRLAETEAFDSEISEESKVLVDTDPNCLGLVESQNVEESIRLLEGVRDKYGTVEWLKTNGKKGYLIF